MARRRRRPQGTEVTQEQPIEYVEAELVSFAQGGDCLSRVDGRVVFIPYGIPGERVVARIIHRKPDFSFGRITEIKEASPHRVEPLCPYYGLCGGCQLQHVAYDHQLTLKRDMVVEQLRRIGGLDDVPVLPTLAAESPWNYRNHARFTVRRGEIGFTHAHSRRFLRVDRCALMDDHINATLARLQDRIQRKVHQLSVRYGVNTGEMLIQPALMAEETDLPTGQPYYEETLLGQAYRVRAASFFQVNTRQAERLIGVVRDWLAPRGDELLYDVYCGVGSFGLILARDVARVVGIEDSAAAVEDARHNARHLTNVEFLLGAAEKVLPELPERPDAVILDPPRAGCRPEVIEAIARTQPAKVVYVSCDPATLARDLKQFTASGYRVEGVQPVDMFPQTQHVECVVLMSRVKG